MTTANSWAFSRQIVFDQNGVTCPGAIAYFYDGGTTTPRTVYQDSNLATPHTWPVTADAYGRFPRVFLQYGDFDEKVTTSGGTQLWYDQSIGNTNPVDTATAVDENGLLTTGDVWWSPINAARDGAVRLNGRTVGNASSGATERANSDTSDLFTFLWNNLADDQAAVSTGRGLTAAADYAANKSIALPDLRASCPFGLDTMGNSAASRLGSAPFTNGNATTTGSVVGANTHVLLEAELAAHVHALTAASAAAGGDHSHGGATGTESANHTHTGSGTTSGQSNNHTHTYNEPTGTTGDTAQTGGTTSSGTTNTGGSSADHTHTYSFTTGGVSANHAHPISASGTHTHTLSGSTDSKGSGTAHNNLSRGVLGTWFIRL